MFAQRIGHCLLLLCLLLPLALVVSAQEGNGWTHEERAAIEREYTYTTAEAVATGRRAAALYWQNEYRYRDLIAAEREFTYTTAAAVAAGKAAADAYDQARP